MDPKSERTGPRLVGDRGRSPEPLQRESAAPGKGGYAVEIRTAAEMQTEIDPWRDLARHAVEANVFAEPDFVLPGIQHLAEGRGVVLLLVWQGAAGVANGGVLRGLIPLAMPRLPVGRQIRVWSPTGASVGIPLIDNKAPTDVLEAALAFLAGRYPRFSGLMVAQVPADGAFAAALKSTAARTLRVVRATAQQKRRVLINPRSDDGVIETTRRRIADALQQRRDELGALGDIHLDHARTSRSVRDAVEELLVLDAARANAEGTEALLQVPGTATFLRVVTRQLASVGRCRADVLRVDGRAVAAAVTLESEHHAWLWHLAADPSVAELSAESLLTLDVTRTQLDRAGLVRTDACKGCSNRVIEAMWQERLSTDCLIGIRPQSLPASVAAGFRERLQRRLRSLAKDAPPPKRWR
jgi:CelD/BcsL family acetyltransferase involved in cellulose biosynthesis